LLDFRLDISPNQTLGTIQLDSVVKAGS